jgi:hypothetical protein
MEPEGSLPSSQKLSTCTYPEPDDYSPQKIHVLILKMLLEEIGTEISGFILRMFFDVIGT